ncbi:hypothetical protein [Desulfoluna spongiiphila]|uniref:hypothetical protein n=1 Tax=Desulfoluna spongiiphila TaxID=419481 RepID=UPI00125AC4C7|nr:hypothetical protein [Desulfoluna spongiiphila]VVS95361.1 hypothetical protein DBB_49380 [Desulfoluna spongiiphila]
MPIAKTVALDFANNHGNSFYMGIRSVDFYKDGALLPLTESDYVAYATSTASTGGRYPKYAFDTSLSKVSVSTHTSWASNSNTYQATNQRLLCVFNNDIDFNEIKINNYHYSGVDTNIGVADTKIYYATTALTSSDTTYGANLDVLTLIYDGQILEHPETDTVSNQELTLISDDGTITFNVPVFTLAMALTVHIKAGAVFDDLRFTLNPKITAFVHDIEAWLAFIRSQNVAQVLYFCTITGAKNGLSDLVVPISSFQSRRKSGAPSYLQVVVPGVDFFEGISARLAGDIVLTMAYKLDGAIAFEESIARVSLDSIGYYKGGKSQSVTLSGNQKSTYLSAKAVVLNHAVLSSVISGKNRIRTAVPDLYLNPGDTVNAAGQSFIAGTITTTVSMSATGRVASAMEVSEV